MTKGITLERIEREIERLTTTEQLKLAEKLARQLRKSGLPVKKGLNWDKLYGLGKGLWKGEDAQDYVSRLRENRI
jgi:hypothetical protein